MIFNAKYVTLGIGLAVFWLYLFHFLIEPGSSPVVHGRLGDPDDYLYLAQALDWLRGQGWYDLVMHRENPPDGTYIHYSRFLSSLYGIVISIIAHVQGKGLVAAALFTAAAMPAVSFAIFLVAQRWVALTFMDEAFAGISLFALLFAPAILMNFNPGHVDHHGLELLIAVMALGCMARMMQYPQSHTWPLLSALALALGLAIGLEFLPFLLLEVSCIGLWIIVEGGVRARTGLILGGALFIFDTIFLLLTKPWADLFAVDVVNYSIVYVMVTAGIACCFGAVYFAHRASASFAWRAGTGIIVALSVAAILLHVFPELKAGPLGGLAPQIAEFTDEYISEAAPMVTWNNISSFGIVTIIETCMALMWPMLGLLACAFIIIHSTPRLRWLWVLVAFPLAAMTAMAAFSEQRFLGYAELFSILPVLYVFNIICQRIEQTYHHRQVYPFSATLLVLGIFLGLAIAPLCDRNWNLTEAASPDGDDSCDAVDFADYLNLSFAEEGRPRLIMSNPDIGAELLFRTRDEVVAVSDFSNTDGIIDFMKFFNATTADDAKSVLKPNVDFVAVCKTNMSYMSAITDHGHYVNDGEGHIKMPFGQQLAHGRMPAWLEPVSIPHGGKLLVFKVQKASL